jgi:threonine dehydrogenase-like Zn-dependent dehydrogenase
LAHAGVDSYRNDEPGGKKIVSLQVANFVTVPSSTPIHLVSHQPMPLPDAATACVAVIGLGYVGLPLTLGFSKASRAIGFDISEGKISELREGIDLTGEANPEDRRRDLGMCAHAG